MKIYTALLVTLFSSFFILTAFENSEEKWFCEDLKYTYQIEVYQSRRQVQVNADLCDIISKNRKKDTDVYIQLYENIRLKIFSEEILNENLKEIPQFIYY